MTAEANGRSAARIFARALIRRRERLVAEAQAGRKTPARRTTEQAPDPD